MPFFQDSKFQRVTKDTKLFDECPTQVVCIAFDDDHESLDTAAGILYHGEIICGCCGGVIEVADLLTYDQFWLMYLDKERRGVWVEFHELIGGDAMDDINDAVKEIDTARSEGWEKLNDIIHKEYNLRIY